MRKIVYLLIILLAPVLNGQSDVVKQYETHSAKIIDKGFFQQLDSIVTNVYKQKYPYYNLYIQGGTNLFYIPNKSDSILNFILAGADTPLVYGFHPFYETKYKNKTYFVGKGADGILIKKGIRKTYVLSRSTIKKNMSRDMGSPSISLEYKNKKLIVTGDSRTDSNY